jgi:broad specificity phosphatase PhoE
MTEIILARHGQTEWNVGQIYRGRIDIDLDRVGLNQAESLGKYLSDLKLDAVYSSPLRRALDTANIIARYQKVDVEVANRLIDFDYGEWQGLPDEEVRKLYPALYDEWHSNPHLVQMPNGESLADVGKRAIAVVDDVISRCRRRVALVSHRVVNKVLICYLLGLDNSHFWNIKQDVSGITVFSYANGRFVLTRHNDTSYLRGLGEYVLGDF